MTQPIRTYALLSLVLVAAAMCGRSKPSPAEHWVATWTTAQELAPSTQEKATLPPGLQMPDFSTMRGPRPSHAAPSIADGQTIRMIVHTSIGGSKLRIELSNAFGKESVLIGDARIAIRRQGSSIDPRSDRQLTFGGGRSFNIGAGINLISDPIDLEVDPTADLAVSLFVLKGGNAPTYHAIGLHTGYVVDGDQTASAELLHPASTTAYAWLRSVDVAASKDGFAIACLGDSITDGYGTTNDANQSWPALLARRLLDRGKGQNIAVVNEGVSGNEVLRDGAGVSALARLDRDIFSTPGVKWVILLEGINDINLHGQVRGPNALTSEDLIRGYRQIIARSHLLGIKVAGATLTPEQGVWLAQDEGEETRLKVNRWIRTGGAFDAVIDFDAILRDQSDPSKLRGEYDPGDHIHPNDLGNAAMADSIDLAKFTD